MKKATCLATAITAVALLVTTTTNCATPAVAQNLAAQRAATTVYQPPAPSAGTVNFSIDPASGHLILRDDRGITVDLDVVAYMFVKIRNIIREGENNAPK